MEDNNLEQFYSTNCQSWSDDDKAALALTIIQDLKGEDAAPKKLGFDFAAFDQFKSFVSLLNKTNISDVLALFASIKKLLATPEAKEVIENAKKVIAEFFKTK